MQDNTMLWENTLQEIASQTSRANFNTWFKNTIIIKHDQGTIVVGVPNEFVKEWLLTKYHKAIVKALRDRDESVRAVEYVITKPEQAAQQQKQIQQQKEEKPNEQPLLELSVSKEDNLNPKYTFDTFVIGPFNELAYSASQAIINRPTVYNPLFIYGGTGLGKTHLIQAVGNTYKQKHPGVKVFYVTSEQFSMDYVNAVQTNKVNPFKEKYRKYDLLIMDDIQFLSGKEKTQEELFHVFNTLYDNNKQILFSSDKHPHFIQGLEDRLRSRFSAGMVVDISQPDYESRFAILKTKAERQHLNIHPKSLEYIATHVQGNVRELEGALNTVMCQIQLKQKQLSQQEIQSLIKSTGKSKKNISIKDIIKIIAEFYNLEEETLYEKTRRKEVVRSRQVAMYILREDFSISYPLIGRKMGGKDHTTVIHSCLKVKEELKNDPEIHNEIEKIRSLLSI